MKLSELKPSPGSRHTKKRVGRGPGCHGKTSAAGCNGQKAKNTVRPGFEGGQTPLHRRLPVRSGFKNLKRTESEIVNLTILEALFEANSVVTPDALIEKGVIASYPYGVKVLADGELTKALTVKAHKFSKAAIEKIKSAGGNAEVI